MTLKQQIIADIELLPEKDLALFSELIKRFLRLNSRTNMKKLQTVFVSDKEKIWEADDLDALLEELKAYMG